MNERVWVLIDGSNLYYKLKDNEIGIFNTSVSTLEFDYHGLCEWLARKRKIESLRYYVGVVRTKQNEKKGQTLRKNQQKLFSHLESKEQGFLVQRGFLMKNSSTYHEKGVDVQLAVDLLVGAYDNQYDTAILLSSDTDLIPAIKKVISLGKKVEYIGFGHQPSFGLQNNCTLSRLLIKEEIEPFSKKQ